MSGKVWYACLVEGCSQRFMLIRGLVNHMRLHHSAERTLNLSCGLGNCQFIYNTVETYRKHVANKHADYWSGSVVPDHASHVYTESPMICENAESSEEEDLDMGFVGGDTVEDAEKEYGKFLNDFGHKLAASMLRAREVFMLPKSTSASIYEDVQSLFDVYEQHFKMQVKSSLKRLSVDIEQDPVLNRVLNSDPIYETVTRDISSEYLFKQYLSKNLNYNAPIEIVLTKNGCKKDVVHYVPLLKSLTHYIQHDDVWASCNVAKQQYSHLLSDYTDGEIWRQNCKKDDKLFLRIHLYTDELEICNPIGSKKGVYKMSAFYFLIGNIETKHWSSLTNIHLLLLTKFSNVKKYGLRKILHPVLEDLRTLETQGISITIGDHTFPVHGSVTTLSADNLSSHLIGGFNGSFSSGRFCRYCLTTYAARQEKMSEEECEIRTSEMHRTHVELVMHDSDVAPLYGVRGECVFSELSCFDPIDSLPPDVMHDIFEGLMQINVKVVVCGLVRAKIISIKQLNEIIGSFPYGQSDIGDKPIMFSADFVKKGRSITGKAVEKWCLFRMLALMIGSYVAMDNEYWELHLLCKEICAIILAPFIDKAWIPYLSLLISRHHALLARLDPQALTPKVHFLVHYPRLILLYGPLRYLWCMRFEAVHQYFKQMVRRIRNFKNITSTLAERFEMRKCCQHQGNLCLSPPVNIRGTQCAIRFPSLPQSLQRLLHDKYQISSQSHLTSVRQVILDTSHYKCNSFIILTTVHEEEIPIFLQVSYILQYHGLWILCGQIHVSTRYIAHYDIFILHDTDEWTAITVGEELNNQMLSSYNLNNEAAISIPFRLCRSSYI